MKSNDTNDLNYLYIERESLMQVIDFYLNICKKINEVLYFRILSLIVFVRLHSNIL